METVNTPAFYNTLTSPEPIQPTDLRRPRMGRERRMKGAHLPTKGVAVCREHSGAGDGKKAELGREQEGKAVANYINFFEYRSTVFRVFSSIVNIRDVLWVGLWLVIRSSVVLSSHVKCSVIKFSLLL